MKRTVPIGWKETLLGEECDIYIGQSPKSTYYNTVGEGTPLYQGKKEFSKVYIKPPVMWTTRVTKEAFTGDILLSMRAPVGDTNIATQRICIGRGLAAIRARKNVDQKYLFYYLTHYKNDIVRNQGSIFDSITKYQINQIHVIHPSLSDQKAIIEILSTWEIAIEKINQIIDTKKCQFTALLQSLIVSPIREGEKGWKRILLGDECDVYTGQSPKSEYYNLVGEGTPLYQGKKEFSMVYINPPTMWTTQVTKEAFAGDILLSMRAPVGDTNIATQRVCIGRGLAAIRARDDIDQKYLFYYLTQYKHKIVRNNGAIFDSITKYQISQIPIWAPSLARQRDIAEILSTVQEEIDVLKKLVRAYELQQKGLMQKLLAGVWRV